MESRRNYYFKIEKRTAYLYTYGYYSAMREECDIAGETKRHTGAKSLVDERNET